MHMARTVGIGHQNFEDIIKNGYFYVDKTDFIREWWENGDAVTLITRPRRFGKTLTMSMVEQFFSTGYAHRSDLFEGLSIWKYENYREMQGTYPVLFLSFADVKEVSFSETRKKICRLIGTLYNRFAYLRESNFLNDNEKGIWDEITPDMADNIASTSLQMLMDFLARYYGKKVIVLLDEYDTPMQEAYINGYWEELVSFIRNLFNATFKTNPYLERAIMTGITRVSKESIFSDLNNPVVVTTTSDSYADRFGFTQDEVTAALEEYRLMEKYQTVKNWYDGFTFGKKTDIYNPWSITNFLKNGKFGTYWANTSSNSLIGSLVQQSSPDFKMVMEDLMKGGILRTQIDEQIVFSQLSMKQSAVWSLFLASGYLKVVSYNMNEDTGRESYELMLTNKEVHIMFERIIQDWFSDYTPAYNEFIKALLKDDKKAMNVYMNRVALDTFSFFDTGKKLSAQSEPERFYHGFVLGLIVDLAERYTITSNRESGLGRYDVVLEPINKAVDDAIIMEFKVFDPEDEKTLDDTVKAALLQIEEKQYAAGLESRGILASHIRSYGFAFQGKKVLIG